MPSSDRSKRPGSARALWILLCLVVLGVGAALVYRNNRELLAARQVHVKTAAAAVQPVRPPAPAQETTPKAPERPVPAPVDKQDAPAREPPKETERSVAVARAVDTPAAPELRASVLIPDISCAILDRQDIRIELTVELFMTGENLRGEVLAKRENLKVMVRKVLAVKRYDEVESGQLKNEIRAEMNAMLGRDTIEEIEFRSFRVVSRHENTR